jgi:hypothetical protein
MEQEIDPQGKFHGEIERNLLESPAETTQRGKETSKAATTGESLW